MSKIDKAPTRATTAAFSIRVLVSIPNRPGNLGRLTTAIGEAGGNIASLDIAEFTGQNVVRAITVHAASEDHAQAIVKAIESVSGVLVIETVDRTFEMHTGGTVEVTPKHKLNDRDDLAMAYTPGVARICQAIAETPSEVHRLTIKENTVAVISDGSAILGLGNLGPQAALPVMEGKALLFKEFGAINAMPICTTASTADEIVKFVEQIAPTFGGINLEDIAAPKCFEIESRLRDSLDIPVFHDDQHGTAVVVLAALQNACKHLKLDLQDISVVIAGVGAAGVACAKILLEAGIGDIVAVDRVGAISKDRTELTEIKKWVAENTNKHSQSGSLQQVLRDKHVFIGVSGPNLVSRQDVSSMAPNPIVFALANPTPEVAPEDIEDIVGVLATGRSDYPNQINNVLCFPGIFRGALDAKATEISEGMKLAAANAIASVVSKDELNANYIIPSVFDRRVVDLVRQSVAECAIAEGICRK